MLKFELEGPTANEDNPVPYIVARLTLVSVSL